MIYARLRFATSIATLTGGIALGCGAFIFGPATERWLGLGVGAALAAMTICAFATVARGTLQRGLDLLLVPVGLWALISARTIELPGHGASPALVKWLGLSSGAAIFVIGVIALVAHELALEADLRWVLDAVESESEGAEDDADEAEAEAEADDEGTVEADGPEAGADAGVDAAGADAEPQVVADAVAASESESDNLAEDTEAGDTEAGDTAAGDESEADDLEDHGSAEAESNGNGNGNGDGNGRASRPMWLTPIHPGRGEGAQA